MQCQRCSFANPQGFEAHYLRMRPLIAHYHLGFKNKGKDLIAWRRYKKELNDRYRYISVNVWDLKVKVEGRMGWAYFRQRYRSDSLLSYGYKLVEFRKEGDSWKIFRERSFVKKPGEWPT